MATRVAAEVKAARGVEATLVRGSGGVFQVRKDGELVFDKAATRRFPDEGEVTRLLG
jgi:hypothetical protein